MISIKSSDIDEHHNSTCEYTGGKTLSSRSLSGTRDLHPKDICNGVEEQVAHEIIGTQHRIVLPSKSLIPLKEYLFTVYFSVFCVLKETGR